MRRNARPKRLLRAKTESPRRTQRREAVVRYAVVGLGHIAQRAVLPVFKKKGLNSRLTAIVSGDPKKLSLLGRAYGVAGRYDYEQYQELLTSGDIDAVYIGLPNSLHERYSVPALQAGIHVLCEKPLAGSVAECRRMIAAAEESGAKLMTAYRLHFDAANLEIIRLVEAGKIGDPKIFSSLFSYQIKGRNSRLEGDLDGGALLDIGIYCINAARYIFRDEPVRVSGRLIRGEDPRFTEVDGTTCGTLYFSNDRHASFSASFAGFPRSVYEVVGTKGSIRAEPAYEYSEALGFTIFTGGRSQKRSFKKHDQFAAEIEYFSDCIMRNLAVEPDGREGLADIRIIEALRRSDESGREVELAPFATDYPDPTMSRRKKPSATSPPQIGVSSASK